MKTLRLLAALVLAGGCGGSPAGDGGGATPDTGPAWGLEDVGRGGGAETSPSPEVRFGTPDEAAPDPDGGLSGDLPLDPDVPKQPEDCVDLDGDGYGPGCYLGADCDGGNPNFNVYCPPCGSQTVAGCPCEQPNLVEFCYEGDPAEVGIGVCSLGERYCDGQYWSACLGQVVATPEACNGLDDDCDGATDEGVLSPCGDCDPLCDTLKAGPDSENPFVPTEDNSEGVGTNLDGFLILDSTKLNLSFIWIANSGESTVSKLDTETGAELARYITCSDPSRTSVDLNGDAWVACRGDGGVAKIHLYEQTCEDKNGNGVIDTSRDENGDLVISGSEMLPAGQDECIKFLVYPGGSLQRGAGVDSENHAWFACYNTKSLRRLHPDDGAVVQTITGLPANPYGLVIDGNNILWISGRGGNQLVRVDPTQTPPQIDSYVSPLGSFSPYGIALDYQGRVWTANCCGKNVAYRFDPTTGQWAEAATGSRPRGLAGSVDGRLYVANDSDSRIAVVDVDSLQTLGYVELGAGRYPVGVAVDFQGNAWAVNQSGSSATKIDPDTLTVIGEYPVGQSPYTYSDMTGYNLHNFTVSQGQYSTIIGGWSEIRVKWESLFVDAEIPEGSSISVEVRTAMTVEALGVTPWQGMFGPFPPATFPMDLSILPAMDGKFLQIRLWLFSEDKESTPIIKEIQAQFNADG
ncbi:MAG: hypothetical protein ABIK09_20715 [Pseudomonadota bacterium]